MLATWIWSIVGTTLIIRSISRWVSWNLTDCIWRRIGSRPYCVRSIVSSRRVCRWSCYMWALCIIRGSMINWSSNVLILIAKYRSLGSIIVWCCYVVVWRSRPPSSIISKCIWSHIAFPCWELTSWCLASMNRLLHPVVWFKHRSVLPTFIIPCEISRVIKSLPFSSIFKLFLIKYKIKSSCSKIT